MSSANVSPGRVVPVVKSKVGKQRHIHAPGISAQNVGARGLWLGSVTLPAGARTEAHVHAGHESALYMLSGDEMELWTGPQLEQREIARPGDYLYIPAGALHVAVNRSAVPAVFVAARTDPNDQESMVIHADLDELVP